ncbi:hypothetical protein SCLCIDRAFT_1207508 [Scleroderma citrinum Foug A]|uniref:Uncharacterized protein n=1 Tax=Scleroderma citrinum Foug A TaxID=1036808 RepID=A0A0C3EQX9_9AGAM|nr:hypothetical protein SCLCIDRAFT_1207508 [Scleroderma citrinum Foug A]
MKLYALLSLSQERTGRRLVSILAAPVTDYNPRDGINYEPSTKYIVTLSLHL